MNYIVLDLEWNQCPYGKDKENPKLPFEIIEIGAVKMDASLHPVDQFREIVRPKVYKSLHHRTKEVVQLKSIDFEHTRAFPEVFADFCAWCGPDALYCTWGPADLFELQRNMEFHHTPYRFPFPLYYYDIQKIYSIVYEDRRTRRSLAYVVDDLHIEKTVPFHSALSDAYYTSRVMEHLTVSQIQKNYSVDYYHTPESRRQELHISYETYDKFVSKPFATKTDIFKDRVTVSTKCPKCHKNARKKIRWFLNGGKNYLCLAFCPEHNYLKGKIRIRQREDGSYYVVKTIRQISEQDAENLAERKSVLRLRRKQKNK